MAVGEKGLRLIKNTLMGLLWIGMCVQVFLGAAWFLGNLPAQGLFPETAYYLDAAAGGALDEYMGFLYPLLIRLLWGIASLWGGEGEALLSLLQLAAAGLCCFGFLSLCDRNGRVSGWKKALGAAYLVTVPLCAQWHLTILPRSLTGSLTFLLLGVCIRSFLERWECPLRRLCQAGGLWILLTWLEPDAWWLGGALVLYTALGLAAGCRRAGKSALLALLAVVLLAGAAARSGNLLAQEPGSRGRIQKSLGSALVSRFVWPNFGKNYFFWPEEIQAVMTPEEGAAFLADDVELVFGPLVEEAYGRERADALYWEMALQCFGNRTREVAEAVEEDFLSYLFLPWRVHEQLHGKGLSYSGWNYDRMWEKTPWLSGRYMEYGLVSFQVGFWCVVLLALVSLYERHGKKAGRSLACAGLCLLCLGSWALWYTMSGAGMMDYGKVTIISLLWFGMIPAALGNLSQGRK